ncbi:MAG: class I SAM-dependent methyltransferase [Gemmatimonadota bacterium]|nr:MAG: class I SAM-dependent methyltransferase [Gemmatimonadota bacterium]
MSTSSRAPEWYRAWFGEEYLALYSHRDEEEAEAGVDLVLRSSVNPPGAILDLACGAGRHMAEFERRGLRAIGLDLSGTLLQQARSRHVGLLLVQGDMRHLPFADRSFELVVNFFTSFGYFAEPEEDARVLAEIHRILRPGGCFALDFLNAERVRSALVSEDERRVGNRRVIQKRRLDEEGTVVVKEILILGPGQEEPEARYCERVRLYAPEELEEMLREAGLELEHTFGDYSGAPACADCPRYILLGHAV